MKRLNPVDMLLDGVRKKPRGKRPGKYRVDLSFVIEVNDPEKEDVRDAIEYVMQQLPHWFRPETFRGRPWRPRRSKGREVR